MSERKDDWRVVVSRIDPVAAERLEALEAHVAARDSRIPRKHKELIMMACSAALRHDSATRAHAGEAMYYGATDEEIVEALSLASLSAGSAVSAGGVEAVADLLTRTGER